MGVKKILFVNDDISLLNLYRQVFADTPNVFFIECHTVEQGLDAINKSQADIVFLDHHLSPDGDEGIEILDILQATRQMEGKMFYATTGDVNVLPRYKERGIGPARPSIFIDLIKESEMTIFPA